MRVVAFQSKDVVIVKMTMGELRNITGVDRYEDFQKKYGFERLDWGNADSDAAKRDVMEKEFIVCEVFQDARDTLTSYENIRKDLQAATTRMLRLTEKMVDLVPKKSDK